MKSGSASPTHLSELALLHAHRDYAQIAPEQTVAGALEALRHSTLTSRIVYLYVVDEDGTLAGVLPTRRLLMAPADAPIRSLMIREVVTLPEDATLLDACELFVMHRLLALPIVDGSRRIRGIIDIDQYTEEIRELDAQDQSEEIFQLIGMRLAEATALPLARRFATRFPWLLCNIGGGVACALIGGLFQPLLQQVIAIALFIPVVLALAESVSIQSLTLALQSPRRRAAAWQEIGRRLAQEILLGILLGIACGLIVGGVATGWQWRIDVGLCIAASITLAVATGAAIGQLVPALLYKLQRDPQVASGPMVLAATDICATVIYLGLSTLSLM